MRFVPAKQSDEGVQPVNGRKPNHQVRKAVSDWKRGRLAPSLGVALLVAGLGLGCEEAPDLDSSGVKRPSSAATATAREERAETRVLVTHPSHKTLQNFAFLVENRILNIPGLRLTAIFPRGSEKALKKARRYVKNRERPWMDVRKLDCEVPEGQVFESNECSKLFRRLIDNSQAIIFTGGADILPAVYGQPAELMTRATSPGRNFFEISLLFHLLDAGDGEALLEEKPNYPVLAICLGMESMNVALGGTLHQDIPSDLYGVRTAEEVLALPPEQQHSCYAERTTTRVPPQHWVSHPIRFTEHWPLSPRSREATEDVLSSHHQAVDKLGRGLQVAATSLDGKVVEALTHRRFENVLGVQFHPEYSRGWTPQRRCTNTVEDNPSSNYRLNTEMAAFYGQFWKDFATKVASEARRKRSHAMTTSAKLAGARREASGEYANRESK